MQLTNEQAEIVATCADDVRKALKDFHAPRVLLFDTRVVKFNDSTDILNEGDTQTFVYEALKDLQNAPRVPAIYDCFSWNRIHYLVMEKVDLPTVDAWIKDGRDEAERQSRFDMACQAVGNALASLFTLSPPVGTEIGQIQGSYAQTQNERGRSTSGYARSTFFGSIDGLRAPLRYTDALALERHVNKVRLIASAYFSKLSTVFTTGSQSPPEEGPTADSQHSGRAAGDDSRRHQAI